MRKQLMVLVLVVLATLLAVQVAAAQGESRNDTFELTGVVSEVGARHFVVNGQAIYALTTSADRGPNVRVGQTVYVQGYVAPDGSYFARVVRVLDEKAGDGPDIYVRFGG
ncbi:MAG: hypothetical protein JW910_01395 [Anaerolineae bacterium]|nr:hypothetical protein [Anaerolineae bacterium]